MEKKKEKESFVNSIQIGLNPSTPNNEVNKILYNFQHQVNAFIFTKYQLAEIPDIFRLIWKLLLTTAGNQSSTTRLASYRATGAFLTRVTPYYPDKVHESFSDVAINATIDFKSSAIIASSFAFLSTFFAAPLLPKFIKTTPVFHHFSSNDPAFSEHLAVIISNLGHLGTEWLKNLLQFFLERVEDSQSRYIIRAVSAIIGHNPKLYIGLVLEWVLTKGPNDIAKYISFLSFLIAPHINEIYDIDLFPIAKAAAQIIGEGKANFTDTDSSFQLLSVHSSSFNVDINENEETDTSSKFQIIVTQTAEPHEKIEISLEQSNSLKRPSFYMMKLPLSILKPNPDDSVLILGAKFKSIASYKEFDATEVFNIYEPYLASEYNETVSSAIQGLSLCINRFLEAVPPERLANPLRRILFTKTVSWYHSFDILRVIKNVNPKLFVEKLGKEFFIELLNCLIGFCFCENESLSHQSISVLTDLTTQSNYSTVVKTVVQRTDFFDSLLLKRAASTITSILLKYTSNYILGVESTVPEFQVKISELDLFSSKLIEASQIYFDHILTTTEIMNFFAVYDIDNSNNQLKQIINAACSIVLSSVEVVSGQEIDNPPFTLENYKFFKSIVETDIFNRNSDIITEDNKDFKSYISPMRASLLCAFKYIKLDDAIFIANISHQLFPLECSRYYSQKWSDLSEKQKNKMLSRITNFLQYVSNEQVHIEWCKICMNEKNLKSQNFLDAIESLKQMAEYYLSNVFESNPSVAAVYCQFLNYTNKENQKDIIQKYLSEITLQDCYKIAELYPDIISYSPDLFSEYHPSCTQSEPNQTDNQSEILNKIVPTVLPSDINTENVHAYYEEVVRKNDIKLMKLLIRYANDNNVILNSMNPKLAYSEESNLIADEYLANHINYDSIKDIDLLNDALPKVNGRWGKYYTSIIMTNPNKLVEQLMYAEKNKKSQIINLCKIVSNIQDNKLLNYKTLFDLSSKLILVAKSTNRYRAILKLMNMALQETKPNEVPQDFLAKFIKWIETDFDNLPPDSLSQMLLLFAQKIPFNYDIAVFVKKCFILCGNRTPAFGHLHQILIGLSSNLRLVGRNYILNLPDVLFPCLKSKIPSSFCVGLRLFEQICLSIPPQQIGQLLMRGLEYLMKKYKKFSQYPSVMEQAYRSLMSFITKKDIPQQHLSLFRFLPASTKLDSSSAAFNASIAFLPAILRIITPQNENFKKIYSYCESLFTIPSAFTYANKCLCEWANRIDTDERETLLLNALLTWLTPTNPSNSSNIAGYKETKEIGDWITTYLKYMSPSKTFSVIGFQFMKSITFGNLYPNLLKLYIQNKNDEELCIFLEGISDMPSIECHKIALKLMKNCNKYKEMIQLAYFDHDCEESQKIIDQLKEYIN